MLKFPSSTSQAILADVSAPGAAAWLPMSFGSKITRRARSAGLDPSERRIRACIVAGKDAIRRWTSARAASSAWV
jgi:hypothetical protein